MRAVCNLEVPWCGQADHPCLLENFLAFLESARQRRVAVFLDYDGTLTPIVKNPDRAYMSDQVHCRPTLQIAACASTCKVMKENQILKETAGKHPAV